MDASSRAPYRWGPARVSWCIGVHMYGTVDAVHPRAVGSDAVGGVNKP